MPLTDLSNVEGLECLFGRKFTGAEWDSDEEEFILDFSGKLLMVCIEYTEYGEPHIQFYTDREGMN